MLISVIDIRDAALDIAEMTAFESKLVQKYGIDRTMFYIMRSYYYERKFCKAALRHLVTERARMYQNDSLSLWTTFKPRHTKTILADALAVFDTGVMYGHLPDAVDAVAVDTDAVA